MKTLILIAILSLSIVAQAIPKKVIIIRHGEEPPGESHNELSEIGRERAAKLPELFAEEQIDHLIAMKPHSGTASVRSVQTLEPIAEKLGLEVKSKYTRDEVSDLVEALKDKKKYRDDVVLIAWSHRGIGDIAKKLGAEEAPEEWGQAFDRYWVLEFDEEGTVTSFQNLPQQLLDGDSKE